MHFDTAIMKSQFHIQWQQRWGNI